jgi:hypothetical protein
MANGATVALLPPTSGLASTCAKTEPSTAIQIGIAVANACEALGVALAEGARMCAGTRALNGERLAAVVTLWLDHIGEIDDFRALAQREGCRELVARHAAEMCQLLGENVPDTAIAKTFDELCGYIVAAAGQVTAIELAYRAH